jgi:hypothetical protein
LLGALQVAALLLGDGVSDRVAAVVALASLDDESLDVLAEVRAPDS